MAATKGPSMLIKRGDGASPEVFTTVGAMRTKGLSLNSNPIDITTDDDVDGNNVVWQTFLSGINSMSVSGDGIGKAIEPLQSITEDLLQGNLNNYQIVVPNIGTFEANMIVESVDFNAAHDGVVEFSLSMRNNEAVAFTAAV